MLNVSSPGLDRNINKNELLLLEVGKEIDVKTFCKINGRKDFSGVLNSYTDEQLELEQTGKSLIIPRKQISKITKHIEF